MRNVYEANSDECSLCVSVSRGSVFLHVIRGIYQMLLSTEQANNLDMSEFSVMIKTETRPRL